MRWQASLVAAWHAGRRGRVRLVRQLSDMECGPACLAMLLGYHGRHATLHELRERVTVGRDGLSVAALIRLAAEEGLTGRIRHVPRDGYAMLGLPALLHWRNRHFVVLERVDTSAATIIDPAFGRRRCTHTDMAADFTGVAVEFDPAPEFQLRSRQSTSHYRRYLTWAFSFSKARYFLVLTILASLGLQLFGLLVPALTAWLVDNHFDWQAYGLIPVSAALVSMTIARTGISLGRGWVIARLQRLIDERISTGFFDHLLRLPYAFFLQRSTGDLLLRLNSNAVIKELLTTQTVAASLDGPMALGFLMVLAWMSPPLAALATASALAQMGMVWLVMNRQRTLAGQMLDARAAEHGCAVETLGGITYVKAVAAEAALLARWRLAFRRTLAATFDLAMLNAATESVLGAVRLLTPIIALLIGLHGVNQGHMSLGVMLAATALVTSFIQPVLTLLQSVQQLQIAGVYMERVLDVLDTEPDIPENVQHAARSVVVGHIGTENDHERKGRRVECRDIEFRFGTSTPPVIKGISCIIPPGGTLGIIGSTGSGKSTLAKLLLGLWRPTRGLVLHDEAPLDDVTSHWLRGRTGAVLQDLDVFNGTIMDNIVLGRQDSSVSDVRRAAALACLDREVMAMPLGYDTYVGDRGVALSGGQRQRLALARALLHQPDFLVLDEATSQLDIATEQAVNKNVSALGCTRLIISHRLSAVEEADWILDLHEGRVVAEGLPEDILRERISSGDLTRRAG